MLTTWSLLIHATRKIMMNNLIFFSLHGGGGRLCMQLFGVEGASLDQAVVLEPKTKLKCGTCQQS